MNDENTHTEQRKRKRRGLITPEKKKNEMTKKEKEKENKYARKFTALFPFIICLLNCKKKRKGSVG